MKKMFLSFWLIAVAGLTTTVFNSCDKDDDKNNEKKTSMFTITATVENGNDHNSLVKRVVLSAYNEEIDEYDALAVGNYANGGFTMTLPNPVEDKYLWSVEENDGFNVSDITAKIGAYSEFFGISSASGNVGSNAYREAVGWFYYGKEDNNSRTYAFPVYADRNVTITGVYEDEWLSWEGERYTYREELNLSLKKGWNWVYETDTESGNTYTWTTTTQPVSGLKWYFEANDYYASSSVSESVRAAKSVSKKGGKFSRFRK